MKRNSFVFYKSFYECLKLLDSNEKIELLDIMCNYAFEEKLPESENKLNGYFNLIKPQIDANNKKYENGCKGGRYGILGGRPKKEKNDDIFIEEWWKIYSNFDN